MYIFDFFEGIFESKVSLGLSVRYFVSVRVRQNLYVGRFLPGLRANSMNLLIIFV